MLEIWRYGQNKGENIPNSQKKDLEQVDQQSVGNVYQLNKNLFKVLVIQEAREKCSSSLSLKLWVLEKNGENCCKTELNGHIQKFLVFGSRH